MTSADKRLHTTAPVALQPPVGSLQKGSTQFSVANAQLCSSSQQQLATMCAACWTTTSAGAVEPQESQDC